MEEKRLAIIGIFVHELTCSEAVNALLHEYGAYIAGRQGVPCRERTEYSDQCTFRQARAHPRCTGQSNVHKINLKRGFLR